MDKSDKIKHAIILLLNPGQILNEKKKYKWYFFLFYPAAGWSLFFLQVYLSRHINSSNTLIQMLVISFILGYLTNLLIGVSLTRILHSINWNIEYDNVIACISLSHTYMFISLVLGFIYRIFDPGISVSFGVSGLLCTLLPIYSGIRNLGVRNPFVPPLLATYVGVIMLFFWKLITVINS